jgi:ElaB/YqjD/DUF883 family membrane-anchored ribosome-binding protein
MDASATNEDGICAAELRLRASRARLRQRLNPTEAAPDAEAQSAAEGAMDAHEMFDQVVKPATAEIVRRYPARSLATAAAVGALLVRLRPWQGIVGSILISTLLNKGGKLAAAWAMDKAADALDAPPPPARPRP